MLAGTESLGRRRELKRGNGMSSFWTAMRGGQVRYLTVDGVRTRVLEAGQQDSRRAIVLLHGSGGHAENWVENVVPLSVAGHVLAPDLLGHGWNSRPPDRVYSYRAVLDHAESLAADLRAEGATEICFGGMSLGATIAGRIAAERPDLVDKLLMLCPPALHPLGTETLERNSAAARELFQHPSAELVRKRFSNTLHNPAVLSDDMVDARIAMCRLPDAERTVISVLDDFNTNWRDYQLDPVALKQIECPTLLVWGRYNDPGPSVAEAAARLIKNVDLVVLENSGHWPHLEDKEAFEKEAVRFLAA
jgi:2-hydroxy-6-oxonona-2,4-dienedioate hydrolase